MIDDRFKLRELHLDVETRSTIDLRKHGPYIYAECPNTDLWCACYAFGNDPIQTWLPNQPCPPAIIRHVEAKGRVIAHNAMFERLIWKHILTPRYGWPKPDLDRWVCTMARAYALALPGSLDGAAMAIGLSDGKDLDGHKLMMKMAKPVKSKLFDDGTLLWANSPDNLARLVQYCEQDVHIERELYRKLPPLSQNEELIWQLDQEINDRGIGADLKLARKAERLATQTLNDLNAEIRTISNGSIAAATAVQQIVRYCQSQGVANVTSLRADQLAVHLTRTDLPPNVQRVLEIRAEASKVSVKKISSLLTDASADGRVRGLLSYHVATTGRWAGRRFQPQNIKRPVNKDQERLIELVQAGDLDDIREAGSPLEVIGDIIRGLIVPAIDNVIYAADYSNIEGRVLAWLAGESWKLDAFRAYDRGKGPDLYKLAYSRSFGVPIEQIDDNMRQLGKVMELALGYQGGSGAFQSMARNYRVEVPDWRADELKEAWRLAHPRTKAFWYSLEKAALDAVKHAVEHKKPELFFAGSRVEDGKPENKDVRKIGFSVHGDYLFMRLPSGRMLSYPYPEIRRMPWRGTQENDVPVTFPENETEPAPESKPVDALLLQGQQQTQPQGKETLTFMSTLNPSNVKRVLPDNRNRSNWARISSYGGSLAENCLTALTPVLTINGWKPIIAVLLTDQIWDGEAWVKHGGAVTRGVRDTIQLDGIGITPEHEVLTAYGWIRAAQTQGFEREAVRLPDSYQRCWYDREEKAVASALRLRETGNVAIERAYSSSFDMFAFLRLQGQGSDRQRTTHARHDQASSVLGMAVHGRSLPVTDASILAQLWRSGHSGLPTLATVFRKFLDRYGIDLSSWIAARTQQQLTWLQSGELLLEHAAATSPQPSYQSQNRYAMGADDGSRRGEVLWHRCDNITVSAAKQSVGSRIVLSPGHKEPVYDILNCGPRRRFVVHGSTAPLIVHNCTQAVARDVMAAAMKRVSKCGYDVVLTVHDEVVTEAPIGYSTDAAFEAIMVTEPWWAKGLPIAAKAWSDIRYKKD